MIGGGSNRRRGGGRIQGGNYSNTVVTVVPSVSTLIIDSPNAIVVNVTCVTSFYVVEFVIIICRTVRR